MLVRLWLAPSHLETVSWRRIQLSRVQRSSSPQINASDVRWVSSRAGNEPSRCLKLCVASSSDQWLWRYSCIDHSVGSGIRSDSELSLLTWDVHYLMSTNQAYTTQCLMAMCALYGRYIFCQLIKHWMSLSIMQQSFYILNEITDWELILVVVKVHYILYDCRSDWSDKLQNGVQGTSSGPVLMWILCRYIIIKWGNAAILFLFPTYISFGFIQHW